MENKDFDFSKLEDQKRFDQLPEEEKESFVDEAHSEALEENKKRDTEDKNQDSIESFYNQENLPPFRAVSDETIDYLAHHNVFESEEIRKGFDENIKSDKRTFVVEVHPLFTRSARESRTRPPGLQSSPPDEIDGVKKYIKMVENREWPPESEEERKKILGNVGHAKIYRLINNSQYSLINTKYISPERLEKLSVEPFIMRTGLIGGNEGVFCMIRLDLDTYNPPGNLQDSYIQEISSQWIKLTKNFLKVVPRLLTLLARDPQWDIRELDQYVKGKNISNLEEVADMLRDDEHKHPLSKVSYSPEGYRKFREKIMTSTYSEEEQRELLLMITTAAEVYSAMNEYLEQKVKYTEGESKKD